MKKLFCLMVTLTAGVVGYLAFASYNDVNSTDLLFQNTEVLASGEGSGGGGCISSSGSCAVEVGGGEIVIHPGMSYAN